MSFPPGWRPRVVFFDVGDTLLRVDPSWSAIYLRACREFGLEIDEAELGDAFRRVAEAGVGADSGPFEATMEASYQRVKAFDERVMAALGRSDLSDPFYRRIGELFRDAETWQVFPEVRGVLDALSGGGVRCAVISNWVWGLPELLHDLDLAHHFEYVVASSRVGFDKPHPGIFRHALELVGVDANEAVHVGDNPLTDAAGARGAGVRVVLVRRRPGDAERLRADPTLVGVPIIVDLRELVALLGVPEPAAARPGVRRGGA